MVLNELRVGNIVSVCGDERRVVSVCDNENIGYIIASNECVYDITSIDPVPITHEKLLEFGFNVDHDNEKITNYRNGRNFEICFNKIDDPICDAGGYYSSDWSKIDYVHELQNYYYWFGNFKKELGGNFVGS